MERRMVAACAFGALAGLAGWNYVWAYRPVARELAQDARNERVDLCAYYRWGVAPTQVVLDLREVAPEASTLDVLRTIFASARALQSEHYDQVVLAWRGTPRFVLAGEDFQRLGQAYDLDDLVDTVHSFHHDVLRLDGTRAYGPRTGVLLGVAARPRNAVVPWVNDGFLGVLSSGLPGAEI